MYHAVLLPSWNLVVNYAVLQAGVGVTAGRTGLAPSWSLILQVYQVILADHAGLAHQGGAMNPQMIHCDDQGLVAPIQSRFG